MPRSLSINGETKAVDVPDETPMLWVLRDELGLTGTKFGCGKGLCGACTIHQDGHAVRSCITPLAACAASRVTTIEGLSSVSDDPLQKAWIEFNVPQCGYCQPGQLMTAAALLKANPNPNDAQIEAAMAGNLCRCGTYPRIKAAIRAVVASNGGGRDGNDKS